jgi:hypothetical protein
MFIMSGYTMGFFFPKQYAQSDKTPQSPKEKRISIALDEARAPAADIEERGTEEGASWPPVFYHRYI